MNKKLWFSFFVLMICAFANGQSESKILTLKETVQRAKEKSPSYFRAATLAENRYWSFRQFRAGNLPQLSFNGTLPNYSSAIQGVTQEDGTIAFRQFEQTFLSGNLSLSQNVPLTGGSFSLSSGLQKTSVYEPIRRENYFSTPFSINYFQPMILYNRLKWNNRIEPLRYQESQQRYDADLENVAIEASQLYFDALTALVNRRIAELNVSNNDTLYKIAEGRFNLGNIAENELLQMELNLLRVQNQFTSTNLDYRVAMQSLKRFLGLPSDEVLELDIPQNVPKVEVPVETALEMARQNTSAVLEFRRRRLEAERDVAQARGQTNYGLNVQANFGLSRQAQELSQSYIDPLNQQNLAVSLTIPIFDWGQAKAQMRSAKANRDLAEVNIQQDEMNFEQTVFLEVTRFNLQPQLLQTAAKADTIAQKRYEIAKARYLTGKIDITNLNIAQNERDLARVNYLNALRNYWVSYYTVRRLTLYDFINGREIDYETDL